MGKIVEKAKYIDMYASLPTLSFGKDGKVYSRFGLLLTFLTIFIIGGMAIWIGIKIFGRHTPSFIQYELPAKEWNPKIPWSTDDFKFGLTLGQEDQDKLVSYSVIYSDPDIGYIPVEERKCQFDLAPEVDFSCFDQDKSTIGKTYLDVRGYSGFFIYYLYCLNGDCYDRDEIKRRLKDEGAVSNFFYDDVLIDPFDYENPMTMTTGITYDQVMLDVGTVLIVELNEVEFTSDNGWIFEDLKTETKLKATITTKVTSGDMLSLQFKYGGTKTVYKRSYPKIQDFLAQIAGFITIITPIFLILVSPYGNLQAIQHMVNEIYEIKLNKPDPKNGESPQKPSAKKKRSPSKAFSLTPVKGLSKGATPKNSEKKAHLSPSPSKSIPFAPHAALVMGGIRKPLAKDDSPPALTEAATPLRLETITLEKTSRGEESQLISPQKTPVEHAKVLIPEERLNGDLEAQEEAMENNDDKNPDECEDVPLRTSDPLKVPWQKWLKSFWRPNPEVQVLKKAKEHIAEAFDLVTLAKKVIEIDKMKACLFTHDQRVIFENLPSSVIVLNPDIDLKSPEAIKQYHWKDSFKGDEVAVRKAYARLQGTTNQLDQLLLRLYENEFIDDGACL